MLPFVRKDGLIYISIPAMKKDCHDNLPKELLLFWSSEDLDTLHDVNYWRNILEHSKHCDILSIKEMESNEEVWKDWIILDNEYSIADRASINAGALKYLNFISIVLKKK